MIVKRSLSVSNHQNNKFLQINGQILPIGFIQTNWHFFKAISCHLAKETIKKQIQNVDRNKHQNEQYSKADVLHQLKMHEAVRKFRIIWEMLKNEDTFTKSHWKIAHDKTTTVQIIWTKMKWLNACADSMNKLKIKWHVWKYSLLGGIMVSILFFDLVLTLWPKYGNESLCTEWVYHSVCYSVGPNGLLNAEIHLKMLDDANTKI